MARPLRLEFAGALYHVTARGDGREDIYLADGDRGLFLDVFAGVQGRYNWTVHAYCLMSNHYHLLVETPDANLSKGMRQLNGIYTQRFNRTYDRVGHVFQGRYKAILVQKEAYLLELARYLAMARAALLPAGPFKPSADSNVGLFGAQNLQGQHHLLPLHLASFRDYASTSPLPH